MLGRVSYYDLVLCEYYESSLCLVGLVQGKISVLSLPSFVFLVLSLSWLAVSWLSHTHKYEVRVDLDKMERERKRERKRDERNKEGNVPFSFPLSIFQYITGFIVICDL